jgi:mono/diheme cytochrome c family protein
MAWGSRLRVVLLTPLALAGCGYPAAPTSTSVRATTTEPTVTASASELAVGLAVFRDHGCGSCHTFLPAGTGGSIGPDLDTTPAKDARRTHMSLVAFLRRSIVHPNAYISPGYPRDVMPHGFGKKLSKPQLADVVAFLDLDSAG